MEVSSFLLFFSHESCEKSKEASPCHFILKQLCRHWTHHQFSQKSNHILPKSAYINILNKIEEFHIVQKGGEKSTRLIVVKLYSLSGWFGLFKAVGEFEYLAIYLFSLSLS